MNHVHDVGDTAISLVRCSMTGKVGPARRHKVEVLFRREREFFHRQRVNGDLHTNGR